MNMKPNRSNREKIASMKKQLSEVMNEDLFATSINLSHRDSGLNLSSRHKRLRSKNSHTNSSSRKFRKKMTQRHHKSKAHIDMSDHSHDFAERGLSEETESEGENVCAIHNKELDMICREPQCETPICSSCILFGEHKGHAYLERDKFFKSIDLVKRGLVRVEKEIAKGEEALRRANEFPSLMERLESQQKKIEKEIEFSCSKTIRQIEARKLELQKETKFFFEKLGRGVAGFVKDNLNEMEQSKEWKRQLKDQMRRVPNDDQDIDAAFAFIKQNNRYINQINDFL